MNFATLLQQFAGTESSTFDELSSRRRILTSWVPKLGLAVLPLGLSAVFNKAQAQTGNQLTNTLNYLLTLEMMLAGYYAKGIQTIGLIPDDDQIALTQMSTNAAANRNFIRSLIMTMGGTPISEPNFDYSGGNGLGTGPYADAFIFYNRFLALAQTFEETTIRAYIGAIPDLMVNSAATQSCLQVQTVKGRHAAMLRKIRRSHGFSTAHSWITQAESGIPSNPSGPTWAGEDNTSQYGVPVANLVNSNAATEAFDEPLTRAAVEYIIDPFIG